MEHCPLLGDEGIWPRSNDSRGLIVVLYDTLPLVLPGLQLPHLDPNVGLAYKETRKQRFNFKSGHIAALNKIC